ncbi:hypothetical protein L7F22_020970 [Adiantum nelumboides]|nr:hypothetical protein [Adiantum nelumboides]
MWSVGKVKLILPPNPIKLFDLWSGETTDSTGRLRMRDVRVALDADVIFYVDEGGSQVLISAHDRGLLKDTAHHCSNATKSWWSFVGKILMNVCKRSMLSNLDMLQFFFVQMSNIGRRAKNATVPMMLPSSSGAGTSSISFKNVEGMEKLLQLRKQLKDEVQEIDKLMEKLFNMRVRY